MKNYRKIIPLALVVLMALACYSLVSNAVKENSDYNHYLSEARKYAELDITKYAIENYNKALTINPTPDIYVEVAEYYERQENSDTKLLNWCEDFFEKYPTNSKSYDCILKAYMKQKDYDSCFDVLSTAEKRNVSSEYIKSVKNELSYTFKLDFNTYDDVGIYGNGFCAVKSKDAWGYVDSYGNQILMFRLLPLQKLKWLLLLIRKVNVILLIIQAQEFWHQKKNISHSEFLLMT
jgi:pentatricopeptide repeat protein